MRIVNPTFGVAPAENKPAAAAAPVNWFTDPIVLFGNNKPNAKELLDGVKSKLAGLRRTDNIDYVFKDSASQPAPSGMIDAVAQKYRIALLALGD
jgi:hypothetical protein